MPSARLYASSPVVITAAKYCGHPIDERVGPQAAVPIGRGVSDVRRNTRIGCGRLSQQFPACPLYTRSTLYTTPPVPPSYLAVRSGTYRTDSPVNTMSTSEYNVHVRHQVRERRLDPAAARVGDPRTGNQTRDRDRYRDHHSKTNLPPPRGAPHLDRRTVRPWRPVHIRVNTILCA